MLRLVTAVMLFCAANGAADVVDASTIHGKTLCGYQGWFRCPGDAAGRGWVHWSRDAKRVAPETLTFETWPDMTEYDANEQYAAPGFTYPDGAQARLYSAPACCTCLSSIRDSVGTI